ncbi:sigma-70 family RNA polymerase sigma factor [Bythopirellula goksoeyrii]|uniref:RNA polymerase sigma factor CarQ n=1 Tax=Bythopirellula goksoeyrii TaxID=1400387 RepID=A0A5B9QFZ3_9BACT|nr:sigma-70 family RNA polymerase sigma factor [Bythopirellula goksoeyrii]QEG36555.1 RNA polymerase sigma factor CarQ [Bythopirellula goksoeyrii]
MENSDTSPELPESMSSERMAEFVDLYSQYYPRLQYYLMALLPTSNDAADVLQETSLVLWKKFGSFETGTNFLAWACKIARLQALKHYERSSRAAKLFDTSVMEKLAVDAMDSAESTTIPLEVLEKCMDRLSYFDQTLIRRRYEPNSSVNMLAKEIGRSANSLSKSLGRIRRALLACIERTIPQEW